MAKVKNLNGTSGKHCSACRTWLNHWRYHSDSSRSTCSVKGCGSEATVGAHVKKVHGLAGRSHYILPMCQRHNKTPGDLRIKRVRHVRANPCS